MRNSFSVIFPLYNYSRLTFGDIYHCLFREGEETLGLKAAPEVMGQKEKRSVLGSLKMITLQSIGPQLSIEKCA